MEGPRKGVSDQLAFSLVELLAAVAIAVALLTLVAPIASDAMRFGARQGAVIKVLNLCDLARIEAISTSKTVYLGFADAQFPEEDSRYRAMLLFKDYTSPVDGPPPANPPKFVPLGKWELLPEGMSFRSQGASAINPTGGAHTVDVEPGEGIPGISAPMAIPVITWNSAGMISSPSQNALRLFLYEGFYQNGQDNFSRQASYFSKPSSDAPFDEIKFARFSGRARVESNRYEAQ